MKEYIDRELAIKQLEFGVTRCALATTADECEEQYKIGAITARQDDIHSIKTLPIADVEPVRHGEWIKTSYYEVHCCSVCGKPSNTSKGLHNFCPECGAKMDGGNT